MTPLLQPASVICRRCGSPMVQRRANRGVHKGSFFWGCSRYPACRETVDIPSTAATPDPVVGAAETSGSVAPLAEVLPGGGAVIGDAGGSARRTYERRRETYDAKRMDRLGKAVPRAVIAAICVGAILSFWGQAFALALLFAAVIGAVILLEPIVPRQSTTAWATGAEGEGRTADYLDPLAAEGFVIFHDRRIPMSPANVDHIVIGPTGVFVVETKNVAGDFRVSGEDVRIGARRVGLVDEVRREVDATWNAVAPVLAPKGLHVIPVVCAHRADLPFFRRSVAGIRIVSGRELPRYIQGQPGVLSAAEIQELRRLVERALPGNG